MRNRFLLAIAILIVGISSFIWSNRPNQSESTTNAASPTPVHSGSPVLSPQEQPKGSETSTQSAKPTPDESRLDRRSPSDWSNSRVIAETNAEASPETGIWQRRRIVQSQDLDLPVYLLESLVEDDAGQAFVLSLDSSYIANQIVISSPSGLDATEANALAQALGWKVKSIGQRGFQAVLETDNYDFDTVPSRLKDLSEASHQIRSEPNYIYYASISPNDPKFLSNQQWGLENDNDTDIDASAGWTLRHSTNNITIAIIDSGTRLDHEDLSGNLWTNPDEIQDNGEDDDNNGYIDDYYGCNVLKPGAFPSDDNGHGTHVAGIAGARGNNGKGITGVVWDTRLMIIKALNSEGRGTVENIAEAIDYAVDNGAQIINASWGSQESSITLQRAIERANERQVFVVAAAGNNASNDIDYPAKYPIPNIVSVGSYDTSGNRSSFSNFSKTEVDLFAPGEDTVSTWHATKDAYTALSGTSMAAPLVSGILALNLDRFPEDSLETQIRRLIASAKPQSALKNLCVSDGIVSLQRSLAMVQVPYPPVVIDSSEQNFATYEDESASFWIEVESKTPANYRWLKDGEEIAGTAKELVIPSSTPDDQGTYTVEITNSDATVSEIFSLKVYPRFRDLEQYATPGVKIHSSSANHWEILEIDGFRVGTNKELPVNTQAFLRFTTTKGGMYRLYAKLDVPGNQNPDAWFLSGKNERFISSKQWMPYDHVLETNGEFATRLAYSQPYYNKIVPAHTLFARAPQFFETGKYPPSISSLSQSSRTTIIGRKINFEVTARGQNLSYQWYQNEQAIEGENGRYYTLTATSADDEGDYYVVISNEYGSIKSDPMPVTIDFTPHAAWASVKEDQNWINAVSTGDSLTLAMNLFGTEPITCQWYFGTNSLELTPIPGATSADLTIESAGMSHSGIYWLEVKNELNSTPYLSDPIGLLVTEDILPPSFKRQEPNEIQFITATGLLVVLEITGGTTGSTPITYTWYKDGERVDRDYYGTSLYIDDPQESDAGTYYLEARNSLGIDQSYRIHLSVTKSLENAIELEDRLITVADPKWNQDTYSIYQKENNWDGEDAIEIYAENNGSLTIGGADKDTVLTFHWKVEGPEGTTLYATPQGETNTLSKTDSTWSEQSIFIRAGWPLIFVLSGPESPKRAWIDSFSISLKPFVVDEIEYTVPRLGKQVTLNAHIHAEDATYQWYRNDQAIPSANSEILVIDQFSANHKGTYYLSASNQWGTISTETVSLAANDATGGILSDSVSLEIDSNTILTSAPSSYSSPYRNISIYNDFPGGPRSFSFKFSGPSVLKLDYAYYFGTLDCTLDDKEYTIQNHWERHIQAIPIPEGNHTLRFSANTNYSTPNLEIFSVRSEPTPEIWLEVFDGPQTNNQKEPLAHFGGIEPLQIKWYKDNNLVHTQDNLTSGISTPPLDGPGYQRHGLYYATITDANGNTTTSETIRNNHIYDSSLALDQSTDKLKLVLPNPEKVFFDLTIKRKGDDSLLLKGPFGENEESNFSIQSPYSYVRFYIKSTGFPEESVLKYNWGYNEVRTLPLNQDWTEIEIQNIYQPTTFEIPQGDSESRLWLDAATIDNRLAFKVHPKPTATYLGANIEFETQLAPYGPEAQISWERDGRVILGQSGSTLSLENIKTSDLGQYTATAKSAKGEIVQSEPALLSLTTEDLGAAIGYPGAKITLSGDSFWVIDNEVSIEGPTSLKSGQLEIGEFSSISIDMDGPAAWGVYSYVEQDNLDIYSSKVWSFSSAEFAGLGQTSRITIVATEGDSQGQTTNTLLRIDRLDLTRFSSHSFEDWAKRYFENTTNQRFSDTSTKSDDPDGDTLPNWLEFALRLDPLNFDRLPQMGIVRSENGGTSIELLLFAARSEGYSISYEFSKDLEHWSPIKPNIQILSSTDEYDEIQVRLSPNTATIDSYFVRWSIHQRGESTSLY